MNSFDKPKGPSSGAVNKRIGTNADASGTNTLFAWMLRLYNYVGTAITNIATMQTGLTTLLTNWTATRAGYVDRIDALVSSRASVIDATNIYNRVGAPGDGAANGSVFGIMRRVYPSVAAFLSTGATPVNIPNGVYTMCGGIRVGQTGRYRIYHEQYVDSGESALFSLKLVVNDIFSNKVARGAVYPCNTANNLAYGRSQQMVGLAAPMGTLAWQGVYSPLEIYLEAGDELIFYGYANPTGVGVAHVRNITLCGTLDPTSTVFI